MEPTHPRARCLRFPLTPGDAKKRKSTLEKIWHNDLASNGTCKFRWTQCVYIVSNWLGNP